MGQQDHHMWGYAILSAENPVTKDSVLLMVTQMDFMNKQGLPEIERHLGHFHFWGSNNERGSGGMAIILTPTTAGPGAPSSLTATDGG